MILLLLLLLPCASCGVQPFSSQRQADSTAWATWKVDGLMADGPTAWVTWKVDSLNVGYEDRHPALTLDGPPGECLGPDCHDWVYSPVHFRQAAQLPTALLGPGERWTEDEREAICHICLRHEWQALKSVPKPVPKTEFERLREQLQVVVSDAPTCGIRIDLDKLLSKDDTLRGTVEILRPIGPWPER